MSAIEHTIKVDAALPLVATVSAGERLKVKVTWIGSHLPSSIVDLAPDIMTFKAYSPLREDRQLFESVHLADEGNAIAWGDGKIDMPATAIERLSAEIMSAESLRSFMHCKNLTRDGLAAQLGVSRRLVGYWLKGQEIPRYIWLACKSLDAVPSATNQISSPSIIMARSLATAETVRELTSMPSAFFGRIVSTKD